MGDVPTNLIYDLVKTMIHITALKQKLSSEVESVGGESDVAMISKWNNFQWIKHENRIV